LKIEKKTRKNRKMSSGRIQVEDKNTFSAAEGKHKTGNAENEETKKSSTNIRSFSDVPAITSEFKKITSYTHADVDVCTEDWNDLFRIRFSNAKDPETNGKRAATVVYSNFMKKLQELSPLWYKIGVTYDLNAESKKDDKKKANYQQFFLERVSLLLQCVEHGMVEVTMLNVRNAMLDPKKFQSFPSIEEYDIFCVCFMYGLSKGHSDFPEKTRQAWVRLVSYYCTKMKELYVEAFSRRASKTIPDDHKKEDTRVSFETRLN
jgi:hypothetical protein